jgi:hypothetical protein
VGAHYKLCYVDGHSAFFTSQDLKSQWGDDWEDAPYEHNAGEPYRPCWHREDKQACDCDICKRDWNEDGTPKWSIVVVMWYGPFETPCTNVTNSRYSVEGINAGLTPWLRTEQWKKPPVAIMAGASFDDFVELIYQAGGKVYTEVRGK